MEAQLLELARAAGTTMVTLMATDAWQRSRDGFAALWRRAGGARPEAIEDELAATRDDLLLARQSDDADAEQELIGEWSGRVRRLLRDHPEIAEELRVVLNELDPEGADRPATVNMRAEARDSARVYQAGRDQHITEG
ncbi:hypothetical protein [Streptomyces sp. NPDC058247]|uniref:hypothetical protein n=1 Tax=Streptomyces sp. NPDC058247 TaxID=3346401 RepID=UPI0036E268E9